MPTPTPPDASEVFGAIGCPTRRRILDILAEGERPVKELAGEFAMSRPAISQHLRILLSVGLVSERRQGREHRYRLEPEKLAPVRDWLAFYEKFWDDNFQRLHRHLSRPPSLPSEPREREAHAQESRKGIRP